ncbi:MAG: DUF4249 domain-containing protein [Bacteroidetes bacterium]|nr:DUF4249 domain-containing protein [Bacteroidota bacterium]
MKSIPFTIAACIVLLAGALTSCETELDMTGIELNRRLVVNALINDKDQLSISVSNTVGIRENTKPGPLQGATVRVKDQFGNSTPFSFNLATNRYEGGIVAQAGRYYRVEVSAPGYTDVWAELTMPQPGSFQKSNWRDSTGLDSFNFPTGTLTVNLNDPGGQSNYYRITILYWDIISAEWKSLSPATNDAELEQDGIPTDDGGYVISDRTFNGKKRSFGFITPFGYSGQTPKFLVITESLSEEYYKYFKSLRDYQNPGGVFTEFTPVFSNVKNGVGVWAGSTIFRDTIQ